ncbi:MAG: GxxExxY protein [Gammaproteobacteria bacterium]|nr:MAG: GxxExxY protein [Gammaproteobacteria bacterium]
MLEEDRLTYRIRGCIYEVFRHLGAGFLEKVYERALVEELKSAGLSVAAQCPIKVHYKDKVVGEYVADMVVEDRVIVELKAHQELTKRDEAQMLNYLKATGLRVGLLVNFTYPKAVVRRYVL